MNMTHSLAHRLSTSALTLALIASLAACGGSGGSSTAAQDGNNTTPVSDVSTASPNAIVGVAATGAPVPDGAYITVISSEGEMTSTALSKGDGSFSIEPTGTGPFLLYVEHNGKRMYGFTPNTGSRANLTQITDAIVRAALPENYMDDAETIGEPLLTSQPAYSVGPNSGIIIKGGFNRRLYSCVEPNSANYQAYLDGTFELSESEYLACMGKIDAYTRELQKQVINLRWPELAATMAANMSAATTKVINSIGVESARQVTAAIGPGNEIDLSAINPLNHVFEANRTKFDALLDRVKIDRTCDNSSAVCVTSYALYQDEDKQNLESISNQVARFRESFVNNEGIPSACRADAFSVFDKPTGGQWGQIINMRSRDVNSLDRANAEFSNNQSSCAVQVGNDFLPVESRSSSVFNSLNCGHFPVGQPSAMFVRLRQFGAPSALDFSDQGNVTACSEFANPDNPDDREISITFDGGDASSPEGYKQYNIRYLRMPID